MQRGCCSTSIHGSEHKSCLLGMGPYSVAAFSLFFRVAKHQGEAFGAVVFEACKHHLCTNG